MGTTYASKITDEASMKTQTAIPAFLVRANYVIDPADKAAFKSLVTRMAKGATQHEGCCFLNAAQDVHDLTYFTWLKVG